MKRIIVLIFVFSTVIPMELFGQTVIRGQNERARSDLAEILRKIMNFGYHGWDAGLTLGTAHLLADIGGTGINYRFSFPDTLSGAIGFQAWGYVRHHYIPFGIDIHYITRQNFKVGLRKAFFDTVNGHAPTQGLNNDAYFFGSFSVGYFFYA